MNMKTILGLSCPCAEAEDTVKTSSRSRTRLISDFPHVFEDGAEFEVFLAHSQRNALTIEKDGQADPYPAWMSAFPKSGRSDRLSSAEIRVCYRPEAVAYYDQELTLYSNNSVDKQLKLWIKEESLTFPGPAHLPFSSFDIARRYRTVKYSGIR